MKQNHWSVVLFHAATMDRAQDLLNTILVDPRLQGRLLCCEDGVTSQDALTGLRLSPHQRQRISAPPMLMLSAGSAWTMTLPPLRAGFLSWGRAVTLTLLLADTTVVLTVLARIVADVEAGSCTAVCGDRPATYGTALYWLAKNVFGGDPEGIGAATAAGRVIGVCVNVLGAVVITGVLLSLAAGFITGRLQHPADLHRDADKDTGQGQNQEKAEAPASTPAPVAVRQTTLSARLAGSTATLAGTALLCGLVAGVLVSKSRRR